MKKINIILALFCAAFLSVSCSDEDELDRNRVILGLGGEEVVANDVDQWIYDNITRPYNIEVKYRWDRSELDLNKTLVPVDEEKVISVVKAMKAIWIDPYVRLVNEAFIRQYSPKKFVLVGSPKYNNNTITLGEAEGGRKIVLYRMNWWDSSSRSTVQDIVKTAHHEFTHILNQTIKFPVEFEEVTAMNYGGTWTNVNNETAIQYGCISPYATDSPTEDFAEMVARIAVYGREWFDDRVETARKYYNGEIAATTTMYYDPAAALRSKESMVSEYMKNVWGVNFYPIVDEVTDQTSDEAKGLVWLVQEAIDNVVAGNF